MLFFKGKFFDQYSFSRPLIAEGLRQPDDDGNTMFLGDETHPLSMVRIEAGGIVDFVFEVEDRTIEISGGFGRPYHDKLIRAAAEFVHRTSLVSGIPVLSKEIVTTAFGLLPYRQQKGIK